MGNNKNIRVKFNCEYCGKESSDKPSHFKKKKRHFCSMTCYAKYRRDYLPKEEQHRFGTGLPVNEQVKRRKAREILNHAIRDGKIYGPLPCAVCHSTHDIQAHHENYDEPLKVKWLCFKHHRQLHYENPELLK